MPRASNIASELELGRLQAIKGDAPCAEIFSAGASSQNGGRGSTQYGVSLLKCKWEPPSAGVRGDESLAKNFNFASFAAARAPSSNAAAQEDTIQRTNGERKR